MTINMALALAKTMQRGHKQILSSRQYKRQMRTMKKVEKTTFNQKAAIIRMLTKKLSDESFTEEDDNDNDEYEGFAFLHNDVVCSTQDKAGIPKNWILLESQSTVAVFSNPRLLTNIQKSKAMLTLHCYAGKSIVTQKGDLKGYGTICYYPEGIANNLSLHKVKEKYKVMYESSTMAGFVVHKSDGTNCIFKPSKKAILL